MLKISVFDKTPYDTPELFAPFGTVRFHTRFNGASAAEADVLFTTFTRPPQTAARIVNMDSSDWFHLDHLPRTGIIQAGPWCEHDVAKWTLGRVPPNPCRVAVIGRGRIGRAVFRHLRRVGYDVTAYPHTVSRIPPVDVITLHTPLSVETSGRFGLRLFVNQRGAVLINSARRGLVPDAQLADALRNGQVAAAHLDGGREFPDGRVVVTPREAWKGPRSALVRPYQVVQILRRIAADKYCAGN